MADYRELLRRAIDALPENNGTARRAVYEKARSALVTQLRAIDPPLPAREITQHRLTLEDCIRQVEQEATEALLRGLRHDDEEPQPTVAPAAEQATPAEPKAVEEPVVEEAAPAEEPPAPAEELSAIVADMAEEQEKAKEEAQPAPTETPVASIEETQSEPEPEPEVQEGKAEEPSAESTVPAVEEVADTAVVPEPEKSDEIEGNEVKTPKAEEAAVVVAEQADEEKPSEAEDAKAAEDAQASTIEAKEEPAAKGVDASSEATVPSPAVEDQPASVVVPDEVKAEPEPTKTEAAAPIVSATPSVGDVGSEKPAENRAPSVADVIAAAQASSSSTKEVPSVSATASSSAADVPPALSKVVEVEVEEPSDDKNADGEEPQATIDRALKALDLEAEGKDGSDLIKKDDPKEADPKAAKMEDDSVVVEDEQVGGNGLTIFLVIAVLLLGGATGGAYWAWKEGYVDLEPIVEQLGLTASAPEVSEPTPTEAPAETPANTGDQVPAQANVRDVTPTSQSGESSDTGSERLTPEPVATTEEPTETPTETSETETPVADAGEGTSTESTPTETTETADTGDRLQAEAPAEASTEPVLNTEDTSTQPVQIGSRSMLIEEQLTGSGGAVPFTGETTWSRDVDELGVPTIKANVSIPARNLSVDILMRKNGDSALPASHLMEVNFSVTESFLGGGIASMPGILLKNEELAQGNPLVGASARIFDNSFLFALSAAESDLATNLKMLSERGWIDLPVVYSTGRKAIVTIEKGTDGAEIFESVLAAWSEAQ